jgi:hypothetical protein
MARVPKVLLLLRLTVVISDENRVSTSPVKEKVGYLAVRGDDPAGCRVCWAQLSSPLCIAPAGSVAVECTQRQDSIPI